MAIAAIRKVEVQQSKEGGRHGVFVRSFRFFSFREASVESLRFDLHELDNSVPPLRCPRLKGGDQGELLIFLSRSDQRLWTKKTSLYRLLLPSPRLREKEGWTSFLSRLSKRSLLCRSLLQALLKKEHVSLKQKAKKGKKPDCLAHRIP